MKLGIIGLPQSGKTTIFNALSGQEMPTGDYSRAEHMAVVKVPDERVENLARLENCQKATHAEIEFFDLAPFTGKGKESSGEMATVHDLKQVDAYVIVIDCFSPGAKTQRDLQALFDEMILADLLQIENNLEKLDRLIQVSGNKERQQELEILREFQKVLDEGRLLLEIGLSEKDEKIIRGYGFISLKPQLVTLNIAEKTLDKSGDIAGQFSEMNRDKIRTVTAICGKLEMELGQLTDDERAEFLQELHLDESALEKFIQLSYNLLGLISFLTFAPVEARAWTIRKGVTALKAAGVVHTDFERGFIKAEVVSYEDYMQYKNMAELKAAARLRLEGKNYIVADGDIILFRFNL
jgi:GTP-binding protein YchF